MAIVSNDPDTIIRDLLAIVERATTHSSDREGGHFAGWNVMAPPFGVCTGHLKWTGGVIVLSGSGFRLEDRTLIGFCSRRCQEWQSAIEAGRAYLARTDLRQRSLDAAS